VSHVTLSRAADDVLHVAVRPSSELGHDRCPRCWRWVPGLESTAHGLLCPRCAGALLS
jgi:isoleucyl-tRNA synthetase